MATKNAKTVKKRPEKASKPNTNAAPCKSCLPCADKCGQKPEPEPEPEHALSIGEALAREGIAAMARSKERKDHADDFYEQKVRDFLRVCSDSGNDPIAVVKQVAETYEIDLSSDGRFDNSIQRDVRSLLMKVLIRFVVDATSFAAGEIAGGNCDWKAILMEYINQRLGCVFKREGRGYGPERPGSREGGLPAYGAFGTSDLVLRLRPIRCPQVIPVVRI